MVSENIGIQQGEHEVSAHSGMMADAFLKKEAAGQDYILDQETGEMVSEEEFKNRRAARFETGREQH